MAEEKKTTMKLDWLHHETTTTDAIPYTNGTQVVRRGESTDPAFEKTCWKCRTKFIYISEAIKHDRDGDYVVCPSCGAFIAHQESPKTADFIPPKCTSDAKCEDRGPKHSDSFTSLEEAAEVYAYNNWESEDYHEGEKDGLHFDPIAHTAKCFKAGAEWAMHYQEKKIADAYEKGKQEGIRVVRSWESSPGQGGY